MASTAQIENDKVVYDRLRPVLSHMQKIWLMDVGGDYQVYRLRLRALARDYKIPVPDDPEEK
jgi:hypothetical protein